MLLLFEALGMFGSFPPGLATMSADDFARHVFLAETVREIDSTVPLTSEIRPDGARLTFRDSADRTSAIKALEYLAHFYPYITHRPLGDRAVHVDAAVSEILAHGRTLFGPIRACADAMGRSAHIQLIGTPCTLFNAGARPRPLGGDLVTLNFGITQLAMHFMMLGPFHYAIGVLDQLGTRNEDAWIESLEPTGELFHVLSGGAATALRNDVVSANLVHASGLLFARHLGLPLPPAEAGWPRPMLPSVRLGIKITARLFSPDTSNEDALPPEQSIVACVIHFVLLHELGHICLGHTERLRNWKPSGQLNTHERAERVAVLRQFELEADAFAFEQAVADASVWSKEAWIEVVMAFLMLIAASETVARSGPEAGQDHPLFWIRILNVLTQESVIKALGASLTSSFRHMANAMLDRLSQKGIITDPRLRPA